MDALAQFGDSTSMFAIAQADVAQQSDLVGTINYLLDDVLGFDRENVFIGLNVTETTTSGGDLVIALSGALGPWSTEVVELLSFAVDSEKLLNDPLYTFELEATIRERVTALVTGYVDRIAEGVAGPERALVIGATGALRDLLANEIMRPLSGLLADSIADLDLPERDDITAILGDSLDALGDTFFKDFLPGITKTYAKLGLAEILTITTTDLDPAWATAINTLGNGVVGRVLDNLLTNYFADDGAEPLDILDNVHFSEQLGAVLTTLLVDFKTIDQEFVDDILGLDGESWIEEQLATLVSSGIRTFIDNQFVSAIEFLGGDFSAFDLDAIFSDVIGTFEGDLASLISSLFLQYSPTDLAELFIEIDNLPEALAVQLGEWIGSKVLGSVIEDLAMQALTSLFGDFTLGAIGGAIFKGLGGLLGAGVGAIAGSVVFELLDYLTDGWLSDVIGDIYDWIRNDSPQAFYQAVFNPATNQFEVGGSYSKDSEADLRQAVQATRDAFMEKVNQVLDFVGQPATIIGGYDDIYMVWGKKHYDEKFAFFIDGNESLRAAQSSDPTFIVMDAIGAVLRRTNFALGDPTIANAYEQWKIELDAAGTSNVGYVGTDAFVGLQAIIGVARFANAYRQDPTEFDALMAGDTALGVTVMQQFLEAEVRGFNGPKSLYGNVLNVEEIGSAAAGDTIHLNGPATKAVARGGDDTVYGSVSNDVISGGTGSDILYGNEGDDIVDGDEGADQIYGWLGADVLRGGAGDDLLGGDGGDDRLEGGDGVDHLFGVDGDDVLFGGAGADVLNGEDGDDLLTGGTGRDFFNGHAGFDTVSYADASGPVRANLATGLATEADTSAPEQLIAIEALTGSAFADELVGDRNGNRLDGGAGIDRLHGGRGSDTYVVDHARDRVIEYAIEGYDRVLSSASYRLGAHIEVLELTGSNESAGIGNDLANVIMGNVAANRIDGRQANDILDGGDGDDLLIGGKGADRMRGGLGDDVYIVDDLGDMVSDVVAGGIDLVQASVDFTLGGHIERLSLIGAARIGTGNALDNVLRGSNGSDTLYGLGGDDLIVGGTGLDTLDGGAGDDVLSGGSGRDTYIGGSGADRFTFLAEDTSAARQFADRILDFSSADGDKIVLRAIDADTNLANDQAFTLIGSAAFGNIAGQLRVQTTNAFTYAEGDTNGDGVADFSIRLNGAVTLVAGDFVL